MIAFLSHQREGVDWLEARQWRGLLNVDPGLGKTLMAIYAFAQWLAENPTGRVLILAPKAAAIVTWPEQLQRWAPGLQFALLAGETPKMRLARLRDRDAQLVVLNIENLTWLRDTIKRDKSMHGLRFLVVDESHRLKAGAGKWFLALRGILKHLDGGRVLLTGTPMPHDRTDLYSQALIVDDGRALGTRLGPARKHAAPEDRNTFRDRWCTYRPNQHVKGGTWEVPDVLWPSMQERLAPIMFTKRLEDTDVQLPPLTERTIPVILPPKARGLYRDIENGLAGELSEGPGGLPAGARWAKTYQLASGFVYQGDPEDAEHGVRPAKWEHQVKIDAVQSLLSSLGGDPALCLVIHRAEVEQLNRRLHDAGHRVRYIHGGVRAHARESIIEDWNAGRLTVLVAQAACVAESLNLQAGGRHVIWYTLPTSWGVYDQAKRRLWRMGQQRPVVVHHVVAQHTVDEPIMKTLRARGRAHKELHKAVQAYLQLQRRRAA